ncbi:MAG: hypothetical protein AAFZ15_11820 [Bacteroidota bacterium]
MNEEIVQIFLTSNFNPEATAEDDNTHTDVFVQLGTGEKYIASFFSYKNIETIKNENLKSGDFLNGRYFWKKNMVLIDNCRKKNVLKVVMDLRERGDFYEVFEKLSG